MKFVKKVHSIHTKILNPNYEASITQFLPDVTAVVLMEDNPQHLVLICDHTGVNIVLQLSWTMDLKSELQVECASMHDKMPNDIFVLYEPLPDNLLLF